MTTNGGGLWTKESASGGGYLGTLNDIDSVDGVMAWAAGFGDRVMKRGNTPATADALPLPPSPVSNALEPPFYVDLWSRSLEPRQQIIVTMTPPAGESFETCLWPPGTQEVADTSAAVAKSRTFDKIKRFKYIVPQGRAARTTSSSGTRTRASRTAATPSRSTCSRRQRTSRRPPRRSPST